MKGLGALWMRAVAAGLVATLNGRSTSLWRAALVAAFAVAPLALAGCASMENSAQQRQVASMLAYLYPDQSKLNQQPAGTAELRVPLRLGLAFVPDSTNDRFRLPEGDRVRLLEQVRRSFSPYPFIRDLELVPSHYLTPGGGFDNLRQIAQLLRLDVIALVSYDQVQHAGATGWSFLYWTGVGAYVIEGDRYDILTVVEAAVIDVPSGRLLMRAMGRSASQGSASMVAFDEKSRKARTSGFDEAVGRLIPALDEELRVFRQRASTDPGIRLVLPPGYDPSSRGAAAR